MASYRDSDCVGCPQGCVNCGRKNGYIVYECDECGATYYEEDFLYKYNGKEICWECLPEEVKENM